MAGPAEGTLFIWLRPCLPLLTCLCNQTCCPQDDYNWCQPILYPVPPRFLNRSNLHLTPPGLKCSQQEGPCCILWPAAAFFFFFFFLVQRKPLSLHIFDHFQHLGPLLPDLKEYSRSKAVSFSLLQWYRSESDSLVRKWEMFNLAKDLNTRKLFHELKIYCWLENPHILFAIGTLIVLHCVNLIVGLSRVCYWTWLFHSNKFPEYRI